MWVAHKTVEGVFTEAHRRCYFTMVYILAAAPNKYCGAELGRDDCEGVVEQWWW